MLIATDHDDLDSVASHFADAHLERPRTHEGAIEVEGDGFHDEHKLAIDRLVDCSATARRRLDYHGLARLACLGDLTPYVLDEDIEDADVDDEQNCTVSSPGKSRGC